MTNRLDQESTLQSIEAEIRTAGARPSGTAAPSTLGFLLRRMRHRSDFPALSDSVARIQRIALGEDESLASLTDEILKDVALTNKLLRLVNTAHYSRSGGNISTVSRAVALIGFHGVRDLALSLVLLEHTQDRAHAERLKEEFLRSLMSAMLARELGAGSGDAEEAFLGAMFQNLGRLLTEYYLVEEAARVREALAAQPAELVGNAAAEARASASVLGISFEALALGVAQEWQLPSTLQECMRKPVGDPPVRQPQRAGERLRWLTFASNQIADRLVRSTPEQFKAGLAEVAVRYARTLGVSAEQIEAATETARRELGQMARAMKLQVPPGSNAARLFMRPDSQDHPDASDAAFESDTLSGLGLPAPVAARGQAQRRPADPTDILAAGIHEVTQAMIENGRLNDVLRMIMETMLRALALRRVVFCMRDAKTDTLTGRFGLGEGAEEAAASIAVPFTSGSDLFAAVCVKGADTLIADATAAHIARRLPAWYRNRIDAPAFLLLPMQIKGAPFALIYADKAVAGSIELGEKELALLRTLRNQAVMAFRQSA